jgi:hypothetical protein
VLLGSFDAEGVLRSVSVRDACRCSAAFLPLHTRRRVAGPPSDEIRRELALVAASRCGVDQALERVHTELGKADEA